MDELVYDYSGNCLGSVFNISGNKGEGFFDNMGLDPSGFYRSIYEYDANGNMRRDHRTKRTVSHNFVNLPTSVASDYGDMISYTYTATGIKLSQALRAGKGNGSLATLQQNHYYPFGMLNPSLSTANTLGALKDNRYLYNGKELQDDFGLDWYDYGARFYDAQIGRWHVTDPKAAKFHWISGYATFNNNPIFYVDPDGRENIPALIWAAKNMANKGVKSNYGSAWFGPTDNRWTYKVGEVPTRSVCYESCFIAYMNSGDGVLPTLRTGFTNKHNAFVGRSTPTGGMNWFKAGDGKDRQIVTDITKGELGDIVFMGEVGDM